jgi:o-succinylbenzoate---CoA ligase
LSQDRSIENALTRDILAEKIYDSCCQRLQGGWLVNLDGRVVFDFAEQKSREFAQHPPNFIAIATRDPIEFIATFLAGSRWGVPLFLCNPQWGITEWEQVDMLTAQVDLAIHRYCIAIPTGGSSGKLKFAIHTWETLSASVWGFRDFYEESAINCFCTLPLYHVSGLMQLMRSLLTDGKLFVSDYHQLYHDLSIGDRISPCDYFISLVPTQLHKLLALDSHWLARFKTILVGGAPPSLDLLDRSRSAGLPLALTYGMTETASQITSLRPNEFLAGNNSCGSVLPHAEIRLELSTTDRIGTIEIAAKSLMLGYFPDLDTGQYCRLTIWVRSTIAAIYRSSVVIVARLSQVAKMYFRSRLSMQLCLLV